MFKWFSVPTPEQIAEEQYQNARRDYLGALAEKEWAEARCAALKARIERLEATPRESHNSVSIKYRWSHNYKTPERAAIWQFSVPNEETRNAMAEADAIAAARKEENEFWRNFSPTGDPVSPNSYSPSRDESPQGDHSPSKTPDVGTGAQTLDKTERRPLDPNATPSWGPIANI